MVTVPEAALDENDRAEAREHDIRGSGKVAPMQSVAVPRGEENRSNPLLRDGILALDGRHHPGSGGGFNLVYHV
jgi:hypothetical protein